MDRYTECLHSRRVQGGIATVANPADYAERIDLIGFGRQNLIANSIDFAPPSDWILSGQDMTTVYRKYEQGDLEQLKQLLLELGYPVEFAELSNNIDAIYKNGGEIILAEKDKRVVGSICVVLDARLAEGLYAEIVSLIVSEQERGKGVGKILVQLAEAWAGKYVQKIRVRANEVRQPAHALYKGRGFEEVKTQKVFIKHL